MPATAVINVTAATAADFAARGYALNSNNLPGDDFGSVDTTALFTAAVAAIYTGNVSPLGSLAVEATTLLQQSFFESVQFTDKNGASHTLQSADADYSQFEGHTTWVWFLGDDFTDYLNNGNTYAFTFTKMADTLPTIVQNALNFTNGGVHLSWTPTEGSGIYDGAFTSFTVYRNSLPVATVASSTIAFVDFPPSDTNTYEIQGAYDNLAANPPIISNDRTTGSSGAGGGSAWNCDCEAASPWETLATLRRRMLIRLGYPNQVDNPPPGMALLIDEFLRGAQLEIYRQVVRAGRRTERFYFWTMVPGQRFYGLSDNEDACDVKLDPEKITWVGFEDLNRAWYRLDEGIPPEYYTRANINFGWPTRFEIRQCIEIFPAPQSPFTLWIKGDFGLAPFDDDADGTTIDSEAVFLLALGNAKGHYGQKDAQLVLGQAGNYIKGVVAGTHGVKRYVPRSQTENPLTPPRFLPLGSDQA